MNIKQWIRDVLTATFQLKDEAPAPVVHLKKPKSRKKSPSQKLKKAA